jgi:hypothetical protein
LSLHVAAGNILIEHGKTVVQVITDPHVREDYLKHADNPRLTYCVFDEPTRIELYEKCAVMGKDIDHSRVVVTGPPVDPRIVAARDKKTAWRNGPLKLCITTGGLGTNKPEIERVLTQMLPELRRRPSPYQVLVYASTHHDIAEMVRELAKKERVAIHPTEDEEARLRLIYHPQIVDANEKLCQYGFPWADGFITKPSGDMAYDAAAAGSFLLTLSEWGVWEHNIKERFEQLGIAREAQVDHIVDQLEVLTATRKKSQSWVESAMNAAFHLDSLYLKGAEHIAEVVGSL